MTKKKNDDDAVKVSSRPSQISSDTVDLAVQTLSGDIRDFILDRLRHEHSPVPWMSRSEAEQRDTIDSVTLAAERVVRETVRIIAGDGRKAMVGKLLQVTVKDGIKAQIELNRHDELRHELMDAEGMQVLLVVADVSAFIGERAEVKVKPDQHDWIDGQVLIGHDVDGDL